MTVTLENREIITATLNKALVNMLLDVYRNGELL